MKPTSLWLFYFVTGSRQDACRNICALVLGTCGEKSSYCKNQKSCHDLFWQSSSRLCNRSSSDCVSQQIVSCEEAARLTFPLFDGSSAMQLWIRPYLSTPVDSVPGLKGFRNLGNSCYLGAALQMLTHSVLFRASISSRPRTSFASSLSLLFHDQWSGEGDEALNPWSMLETLIVGHGFTYTQVEDTHEAIVSLLDHIDASSLFTLTLNRSRTCSNCSAFRTIREPQIGLMLPIQGSTITEAIEASFLPEEVPDVECETCALRADSDLTPSVSVWPSILLISLIRFRFDGSKIDTDIRIEETLSLPGGTYILRSIIHHIGDTVDTGHYVTDFLMETTWYEGDDDSVKEKPVTLNGSTPYVLMYEKIVS